MKIVLELTSVGCFGILPLRMLWKVREMFLLFYIKRNQICTKQSFYHYTKRKRITYFWLWSLSLGTILSPLWPLPFQWWSHLDHWSHMPQKACSLCIARQIRISFLSAKKYQSQKKKKKSIFFLESTLS